MAYEKHWLPGFNFNVEEWFEGDQYETLASMKRRLPELGSLIRSDGNRQVFVFKKQEKREKRVKLIYPNSLRHEDQRDEPRFLGCARYGRKL